MKSIIFSISTSIIFLSFPFCIAHSASEVNFEKVILEGNQLTGNFTLDKQKNTLSFLKNSQNTAELKNVTLECSAPNKFCHFNGFAYNPVIGKITFSNVRYDQTSEKLSGHLSSQIGDFSVEGIKLQKDDILTLSKTTFTANHTTQLDFRRKWNHSNILIQIKKNETILQNFYHTLVDFSLAGNFTIVITETNPSTQQFIQKSQNIIIDSNEVSKEIFSGNYLAKGKGGNNCKKPSRMEFSKQSGNLILCDKYGNAIVPKNPEIHYTITKDAFPNPTKESKTQTKNYFHFANDGIPKSILVEKIIHDGKDVVNLVNGGIYSAKPNIEISQQGSLQKNRNNTIHIKKNGYNGNITLVMEYGFFSDIKNGNPCGFITLNTNKNRKCFNIPANANTFTFYYTGSENLNITPITEINGQKYRAGNTQTFIPTDPYKIFGVIGSSTMNTSSNSGDSFFKTSNKRREFINSIRRNIAYLKRNNQNASTNDYEIIEGDKNLGANDNKKSYIIIGGNVTISENIAENPDKSPRAIIVVKNNLNGGNIIIDENVTNINSSLIAEGKIQTQGNKPLSIFGSIIAENACLENKAECISMMRNQPLSLKHNPNLINNPPPGLANFVQ